MKKILLAAGFLSLLASSAFAGKILSLSGNVVYKNDGIFLKEGDAIDDFDLVTCGLRSSCTIEHDGTLIEISPLSRVLIRRAVQRKKDKIAFLDVEKGIASVLSSNAIVRTPNADLHIKESFIEVNVTNSLSFLKSLSGPARVYPKSSLFLNEENEIVEKKEDIFYIENGTSYNGVPQSDRNKKLPVQSNALGLFDLDKNKSIKGEK